MSISIIQSDAVLCRADSWLADVYATTPIMSTYLLCVLVGEFVYVEAEWQNVTTYPVRKQCNNAIILRLYSGKWALSYDVVRFCLSVCLSPTSTLNLHLAEGAAVALLSWGRADLIASTYRGLTLIIL